MEYRTLNPGDRLYPRRLVERLADLAPVLHYHGPLKLLKRFTFAVAATDEIPGAAMVATNELLFTIRDYAMNYAGGWHSVMETEIFRLALYRKHDPLGLRSVTLCSARGLQHETWDRILLDRFGDGPLSGFPEKEEYYRRVREGELLVLSAAESSTEEFTRENILARNLLAAALSDVVFIPFAARGTKTYELCERVLDLRIPVFTSACPENADLHALGIPVFRRKDVGRFLEGLGAARTGEPPFPPKDPLGPTTIHPTGDASLVQESLWPEPRRRHTRRPGGKAAQ